MSLKTLKKKAKSTEQIRPRDPYIYIKENKETEEKINLLLKKAGELHDQIVKLQPTREASLAITKLEESIMWAQKAAKVMQENPLKFV